SSSGVGSSQRRPSVLCVPKSCSARRGSVKRTAVRLGPDEQQPGGRYREAWNPGAHSPVGIEARVPGDDALLAECRAAVVGAGGEDRRRVPVARVRLAGPGREGPQGVEGAVRGDRELGPGKAPALADPDCRLDRPTPVERASKGELTRARVAP